MDRLIMQDLKKWYESDDGRILFLCGAPKVGKTWVVEELCRQTECEYTIISVNLPRQEENDVKGFKVLIIHDVYNDKTLAMAQRIILNLRADEPACHIRIIIEVNISDKSWFIQHFIDESYVKIIQVFPLNFVEYKNVMSKRYCFDDNELTKMYLLTGGLPECVEYFYRNGDFGGVRHIQHRIIYDIYDRVNTKCRQILESVPSQLISKNESFRYRQVAPNARKREYGDALMSLERNGVLYEIKEFKERNYTNKDNFKIYIYDVGLLAYLMEIDARAVMNVDILYKLHNRMLIKSFIIQEINSLGLHDVCEMYYWIRPRAKARLPLVIRIKELNVIAPILICDGKRCGRSLNSFGNMYEITKIYRIPVVRCFIDNRVCTLAEGDVEVPLWSIHKIKADIKTIIKHKQME